MAQACLGVCHHPLTKRLTKSSFSPLEGIMLSNKGFNNKVFNKGSSKDFNKVSTTSLMLALPQTQGPTFSDRSNICSSWVLLQNQCLISRESQSLPEVKSQGLWFWSVWQISLSRLRFMDIREQMCPNKAFMSNTLPSKTTTSHKKRMSSESRTCHRELCPRKKVWTGKTSSKFDRCDPCIILIIAIHVIVIINININEVGLRGQPWRKFTQKETKPSVTSTVDQSLVFTNNLANE